MIARGCLFVRPDECGAAPGSTCWVLAHRYRSLARRSESEEAACSMDGSHVIVMLHRAVVRHPLIALKEGPMSSKSKLRCFVGVLSACVVAISGAAGEPERRPELGEEPGAAAKVNVGVVIHEGVELLDFAGPGEVFKQAGFRVFTVAPGREPITSMDFVKIVPEFAITDAPRIDILVIPGGNTNVLLNDSAVIEWIKKTSPETKLTLTVCTGAFALA